MQDNVVQMMNKYVGVPYKHGGRAMDGADCWGLALMVYHDLGFELWDIKDAYDETWEWNDRSLFIENYHREWKRVSKPFVFDGVLFQNKKGLVVHGGIMLDDNKFMHASRKTGVVIARVSDLLWRKSFEGYYHLKARDAS